MEAFAQLHAKAMMPVHWGLFNLALHGWREPIERVRELAEERGICLFQPEPGVPTEVVEGVGVTSEWWRGRVRQGEAGKSRVRQGEQERVG